MKRALFIDRDGTLIIEPEDEQVDSLEKLEFYPFVFRHLSYIARQLDFEVVMVTNQDGLGTDSFPEEDFWPVQKKMLKTFENEGIFFDHILIDRSFPEDDSPNRKPGTGMMKRYLEGDYDMNHSYVIGDRLTDVQLAKNMGCKAILLTPGNFFRELQQKELTDTCVLMTDEWKQIRDFLSSEDREAEVIRKTKETDIRVKLSLNGTGKAQIKTGLGFFDHMLEQIARHSGSDIVIEVNGDLHVDEHHTIEDTALVLGEAFLKALGNKRGIERYGYVIPMDDCLAQCVIDFGGRNWIEWDVSFSREKVGDMPTEMVYHFFKSFSDAAKANLNIKAEGTNEHHKIEALFKALGRAIKMAVKKDVFNYELPSTKGAL